MGFVNELEKTLRANASEEIAKPMQAYMKHNFAFVGIKNEFRKTLLKPLMHIYSDEIKLNFRDIVLELWQLPEREFHYCAMDILQKEIRKNYREDDIVFIENLIVSKNWWDSVDFLAKHVLGNYLLEFPDRVDTAIPEFSGSENIWLKRSAILFQLGYKSKTNPDRLFSECEKHAQSSEFFIRKAIGWALREYAKTNPEAVREFVSRTNLSPLSAREALKNL